MGNIVGILIQLVTGAIGGNAAGKAMPKLSLGNVGNTIAGIVGGGLGGQILSLLGIAGGSAGSLDLSSILASVLSGGVGGGALIAIISAVKGAFEKK